MSFIDNMNERPEVKKDIVDPLTKLEACATWDNGSCTHQAFKGKPCPKDPDCQLWAGTEKEKK